MTGIPADTLRAWEKRYQVVSPGRTTRGRLYTQGDIDRLLLLREALRCGHSIAKISGLSNTKLQKLIRTSMTRETSSRKEWVRGNDEQLLIPFLLAVERFDYLRAESELNKAAAMVGGPQRLVYRLALPLMRIAGERWDCGDFSVAQEHMVTMLLSNFLGAVLRTHLQETYPATILLASTPEEKHAFGLLAAAVLAASSGLGVIYLGPELPPEEIVAAARSSEADVVVVAVYESWPLNRMEDLVVIARRLPRRIKLWLGGPRPRQLVQSPGLGRFLALPDFFTFEKQLKHWSS